MAYLNSKPRYEILDALRGVAALLVLIYHHFEVLGPGIDAFHGYLAVDFFYILSGFVIGYAYDDRWQSADNPEGMTLWQFFKRRLTRLHPMVLMSTFIGVLLLYFGMSDALPVIRDAHWPYILICIVFACIMIPTPKCFDVHGWQNFNAFNGNAWTLYFEYLANILYALVIRRFGKVLLGIFVFLSALLTVNIGLNIDIFNVFGAREAAHTYTFIGGWALSPDQLCIGFSRLLYPFFAGLLLARMLRGCSQRDSVFRRHGYLISTLLLIAVLIVPPIGGAQHSLANGIYEIIIILLVFPGIVTIGSKGTVSGKAAKFCKWLGDISYPLYITHFPIIFVLCMGWHSNNPDATPDQVFFVALCSITLSILTAWASLKLYDEPVRQWLKEHWLKK